MQRRPRPRVAAAAARAAIEIREYDGRDVPEWLRAAARLTDPPQNRHVP
ncbi:hypothetical protein WDY80_09500 [Gordonia hongkongensis]|uniref:Uncharacterized protein n=1 Tax=Gordonia aquimaris TaxID=2984863 RepID=A0A9X3D3T0_9ACTN|nr:MULTISPECIES: hypothetical protein [Gordonia]MCX2964195.1 hypothetical protein [Gordonia aquimaris]MDJ0096970.1 hypothetical protein [Gordonia alkanivorans]UCZ90278.1 hypothetical protein LEL84_00755 [Gordonia sp. WA4-43]